MSAFITALGKSKRGLVSWAMFAGKKRMARINAMIPNGTLIRNSHFYDEMDKIAAAIVGPAAEETATIKELIPHTSSQMTLGVDKTNQRRVYAH